MEFIRIEPLIVNGREIIPAFQIGSEIERMINMLFPYYIDFSLDIYRVMPTLAQLHHAFETNREIRDSVYYCGSESTATFHEPRGPKAGEVIPRGYKPIRLINRPWRIFKNGGLWMAEGGEMFDILEPPEGYVTRYSKETGYPEETSDDYAEARNVFDEDASYFYGAPNRLNSIRLRVVKISQERVHGNYPGPFSVYAGSELGSRFSDFFYRKVIYNPDIRGRLSLANRGGELSLADDQHGQLSLASDS